MKKIHRTFSSTQNSAVLHRLMRLSIERRQKSGKGAIAHPWQKLEAKFLSSQCSFHCIILQRNLLILHVIIFINIDDDY